MIAAGIGSETDVVRTDDVDGRRELSFSALCNQLQNTASDHAHRDFGIDDRDDQQIGSRPRAGGRCMSARRRPVRGPKHMHDVPLGDRPGARDRLIP